MTRTSSRNEETVEALRVANRDLADIKYAIDQASIVAITDQRGAITYVNDKFCEISKYSREELIGQDHRILNSGYHPKAFIRNLWRTVAQGRVWRGEIRNRAKDGTHYWVDTTIVPLLDDDQRPRQYLAIRTDITERKRFEVLLRQKESMAQLGQMAAVIAHEVKNPLAGISGAIQVIVKRLEADSQEVQVLNEIRNRIASLNESLSSLLAFARPKIPQLRPVRTREIIAKPQMVIANDPKYVDVDLELAGPDLTVIADPDLLGQALLNLVINAVQASEGAGRVRIVVGADSRDVTISVHDQGPGLPSNGDIFQPFFTTKISGTGLGLAVVKQIAEAHGGSIEATSTEDGTAMTLRLPRSTPPEAPPAR